MTTVGERLAQARRLLSVVLGKDVSQDGLALMAGMAKGSMSQWENGFKMPSESTMAAIVAVMQQHGMGYITLPWLRYGVGEGPPVLGNAPVKPERTLIPAKPGVRLASKKPRPDGKGHNRKGRAS